MPFYAEESLPAKLGIKPGNTVCVIHPPAGYLEELGATIMQARLVSGVEENADILHIFSQTKKELEEELPALKKILGLHFALWISWPKHISGIKTDLNERLVRDLAQRNGLRDVKDCSINDDWAGLKFVHRSKTKRVP